MPPLPAYTNALRDNLEVFLEHWGPISWKDVVREIEQQENPKIARLLAGLAGIEDDAFYMQKKLSLSGSARLDPVKQFNAVWLVEEAEHGRALAAMAKRYSSAPSLVDFQQHGTLRRDRRSILAIPSLKAISYYKRGALAAYLVVGTTVEYVAVTTYNAIAKELDDPVARNILMQMSKQEGRHMRFYRKGAIAVMADDPRSQRFVRWVLREFWRPPGIDLYGYEQWVDIFEPLLRMPEVREGYLHLDEVCSQLPGLENTEIMKPFLERCSKTLDTRSRTAMTAL